MSVAQLMPRYDRSQTYRWNYDHAPQPRNDVVIPSIPGQWTFCGRNVPSPLAIAAGPLLNGRWILYYASLGFDILTYKTVRSRARDCYPLPNLQPVETAELKASGRTLLGVDEMRGSWAVSFGMPSMSPDVWRADVEWTRSRLAKEKLLSVSVVASSEPAWTLENLSADFAQCARWAVESGADCIETNFSCPNVSTADGQLYQQPAAAAFVAQRVRDCIGRTPYVIKVGYFDDQQQCGELLDALAPHCDALAMTNCIAATVHTPLAGTKPGPGDFLYGGDARGIGGDAIRTASVAQVQCFVELARQRDYSTTIIGGGGISSASHVQQYLQAGAEAVQLATAPMINPLVAVEIRSELSRRLS